MVTENELLAVFESVPLNVADPVVGIVPAIVVVILMVTTIVCPTGKLAVLQVTIPPAVPGAGAEQVPPALAVTEPNLKDEGRVVENTTPFATWLLPFLICQV